MVVPKTEIDGFVAAHADKPAGPDILRGGSLSSAPIPWSMYHAANSLTRSSARVSRPNSDPVAVSGAIIFSAVFLADYGPKLA